MVVGSGPNGLAAAIRLQQAELEVLVVEGKETIGGGLRTKELTLPGFHHDVCSAIHPMAVSSPFFSKLPLDRFGLEYIHPPVLAAHPMDDGTAAALYHSITKTATSLEEDGPNYLSLMAPILKNWDKLVPDFMAPLKIPQHPIPLGLFGLRALRSAEGLGKAVFNSEKARGFWAGMAAHSIQPLSNLTTSAIGLVLLAAGHGKGWPIPKGGSQSIANALGAYFKSLGGEIQTDFLVRNLKDLPHSKAVILDITPKQLLEISGSRLSSFYKWQLGHFRYGMGVFKMDWALNAPIPFIAPEARMAGTVHLGSTLTEIADAEKQTSKGYHPQRPYVLVAQQSKFDILRAPDSYHTAWAYCHVPHGSTKDMKQIIENQIDRYAPGFKNTIIATSTLNTQQMQAYNPNYIGGDINGGILDISQLYTRPALRISPYRTSQKGLYICSSSTPPGGGVHGMCGFYAAERALKDLF